MNLQYDHYESHNALYSQNIRHYESLYLFVHLPPCLLANLSRNINPTHREKFIPHLQSPSPPLSGSPSTTPSSPYTVVCTAGFPARNFFGVLADQGSSANYPNVVRSKVP